MEKIFVSEILKAVGGQLLGKVDADRTFVVNVQTDSRAAAAGDLFVAIIGERLDAHRFVMSAMEKEQRAALSAQRRRRSPKANSAYWSRIR